jgi:hypothetical protein
MRGGERCEPGGGRAWGAWWWHTRGMHGARLKAWRPRARAEHTSNMERMVVTLEVSKLSGWLKADARCRAEGRSCDAGGRGASRKAGGPVVWWRHDKRHARRWSDLTPGGQGHARRAHVEHAVHGRDAGGVEVQERLVEG